MLDKATKIYNKIYNDEMNFNEASLEAQDALKWLLSELLKA